MLLFSKLASFYAVGAVGWRSFKTLKRNIVAYELLIVWVVLASLELFELHIEWIISWVPFYYLIKTAIVIMIALPGNHLPRILFEHLIAPYAVRWDDVIVNSIIPNVIDLVLSVPTFFLDLFFPSDEIPNSHHQGGGGGEHAAAANMQGRGVRRRSDGGNNNRTGESSSSRETIIHKTTSAAAVAAGEGSSGGEPIELRRRHHHHHHPTRTSEGTREGVALLSNQSKERHQIDGQGGGGEIKGSSTTATAAGAETGWKDWEDRLARVQARMTSSSKGGGGGGGGSITTTATVASKTGSSSRVRRLSSSGHSTKSNDSSSGGGDNPTRSGPIRPITRISPRPPAYPPPGLIAESKDGDGAGGGIRVGGTHAISNTSSSFYMQSASSSTTRRSLRSGISRKGSGGNASSSSSAASGGSSSSSRRVINYEGGEGKGGEGGRDEQDSAGSSSINKSKVRKKTTTTATADTRKWK